MLLIFLAVIALFYLFIQKGLFIQWGNAQNETARQQECDNSEPAEREDARELSNISDKVAEELELGVAALARIMEIRRSSEMLSNRKLDKDYQRSIGWDFEQVGCSVIYPGILYGEMDTLIDVICVKVNIISLIQCNRLDSTKMINKNTVRQFHASCKEFVASGGLDSGGLVFLFFIMTTTTLTPSAKSEADALGIQFAENMGMTKDYPKIKCTTTKNGEKLYRTPDDHDYDLFLPGKTIYVSSVSEAETLDYKKNNLNLTKEREWYVIDRLAESVMRKSKEVDYAH